MIRYKYILYIVPFLLFTGAFAQQNPSFQIYKTYHTAIDLLDKGEYVAAAQQFRQVKEAKLKTSNQPRFETQLSLVQENCEYYEAVCALELQNDDAESMFLRFIREHPENPLTKLAYFQIGRSYFKKENYTEALNWFNKIDAGSLDGGSYLEYKFRKGYAYFATKDYKDAQELFSEVKGRRSKFRDDATYYFAYIAYLNKDYSIALVNFERLKNSKKYESSYPYYITAVYFLDKRYDDVLNYAIPIINNTHQQHETEMLRIIAASYFAKADYTDAEKYYKRFEDEDLGRTQNTQDSYQMGYTYYKTGNYPKAASELEKLQQENDVFSQNGNYILGDVFLKLNNKQSARSAYFLASKMDFDKQLQQDALYEYAKLSYELNYNTQALGATRLYLKSYPHSGRNDEVKTLLGEELLNSHDYEEAVEILEPIPNKSLSAQTAYQKVTYYRGLEFYNEGAFENAIGIFLRSLKYPLDQRVTTLTTYWMAESMYEVRKYGEAIENFQKFLDMPDARQTSIYNYANYALAYAAFGGQRYKKAAVYFQKFLDGYDKDRNTENDAIARLGDCYFELKDYNRAQQYYDKLVERHSPGQDYALFQRGMIQGLQGSSANKISTLSSLLTGFPHSDYADDASFEIAYTYYLAGDSTQAKNGMLDMMQKYPNSSYVPSALVTLGMINYNSGDDDLAIAAFKKVVQDYSSTEEAKQALQEIQKIYTEKGDAQSFINYAATVPIANYTTADQENIMYQAANNLYLRGDWQGTVGAVNAYFDKFPNKPIYEKGARFIRAQALVKLGRYNDAVNDYNVILNDWTSAFTEQSLISMAKLYLAQKKYNDAVPYLKKLEITSEYKADYTFAINNLLICYSKMNMPDDALNYVQQVRENEKSSQEDKYETGLYAGLAYLEKGDTTTAIKEFNYTVAKTKTAAAAEAKYNVARVEYLKGHYKTSQKICFELIKDMPNYDYWVAKTFILLADTYAATKDNFQAKATLQSLLDNYKAKDDILPTARQRLQQLSAHGKAALKTDTSMRAQPGTATDTTQSAPADTSGIKIINPDTTGTKTVKPDTSGVKNQ